jgi:hypothetical protein
VRGGVDLKHDSDKAHVHDILSSVTTSVGLGIINSFFCLAHL